VTDEPVVHEAAAVGFDRGAGAYERARPSYPQLAVDHVVAQLHIEPASRVLDLAAGTGKFTRLLAPIGASLVAVEPVPGMRAVLAEVVPGVELLDGTAEVIPLEDASVDAVVCAQAFHWFDAPKALAEIRRVLRPGGGLAVIFNIRDESVAWVAELTALTGVYDAPRPHHTESRQAFAGFVADDGGYGPVTVTTFRYEQRLDEDALVERVLSQSWIAAMGDAEQAALLDQVRHLARTHPDLAGRAELTMPYDTEVTICHRH
jgi:ubiquinone/menaquinone biosynthesis C-methylase UbiE